MTPFIETALIVIFISAAFIYLGYVAVSYVKKLKRIQAGGGCGGCSKVVGSPCEPGQQPKIVSKVELL